MPIDAQTLSEGRRLQEAAKECGPPPMPDKSPPEEVAFEAWLMCHSSDLIDATAKLEHAKSVCRENFYDDLLYDLTDGKEGK